MGLMVDTNVFIRFEKSGKPIDFSSWEGSQKVYISAVIVSELLMGIHRANTDERRQRPVGLRRSRHCGYWCFGLYRSRRARSCRNPCRTGEQGANDRHP